MKKFVNSKVFVFILGIVVCSATTALASTMLARNIAYTPKDAKWKVDNVEAAIDSLMLSKTETDYSTEERVVGTWVDGKKLYQKTLTKRITSNGKTIIEQLDSNINVVSIDGILLLDSGFKNSINSYYKQVTTIWLNVEAITRCKYF